MPLRNNNVFVRIEASEGTADNLDQSTTESTALNHRSSGDGRNGESLLKTATTHVHLQRTKGTKFRRRQKLATKSFAQHRASLTRDSAVELDGV